VAGGIELQGVVDSGAGERALEYPGLLGGERVVVGGAGHVDRGGDALRQEVGARRVAGDSQPAAVNDADSQTARSGILDLYAFPAATQQRHPVAEIVSIAGAYPAPTFSHAAEAFLAAHTAPSSWSPGTAVKYRQTLAALAAQLAALAPAATAGGFRVYLGRTPRTCRSPGGR
jgi:hypothetical protein